jgi:hypothetical protein
MPWTRKLSNPIFLRDTRVLATLSDARQFLLDLPSRDQRNARWQPTWALLLDASRKQSILASAEAQLRTALNADGWCDLKETKKVPADLPTGPKHAEPAGA